MSNIGFELIYPPGCKQLSDDLRIDELRRRLTDLSHALDKIIDEESSKLDSAFEGCSNSGVIEHSKYRGLFLLITSPEYIHHNDVDIQMRIAVCICKMMKIFCPANPFAGMSDSAQLTKNTLHFILSCITHLCNVRDKGDILYPKLHAILYICCQIDLLLWCATLEDEKLMFECIRTIFSIVRNLNAWAWTEPSIIRQMVLDMAVKILLHAENTMPPAVISFILELLIEPARSSQPEQHSFARDVILRTAVHLEYHIQMLLQNALIASAKEESAKPTPSSVTTPTQDAVDAVTSDNVDLDDTTSVNSEKTPLFGEHTFLIIYALHTIQDSIISPILPTIELKVKSPIVRERKRAVRLLARLFSEPNSLLYEKNRSLWEAFLSRFNDIDKEVRKLCVHMVPQLLKSNTYLPHDHVLSAIIQRAHDPDEDVRLLVMCTISKLVSESYDSLTDEVFVLLKERTRDKTLSIRKEAAMALGNIYRHGLQAVQFSTDRFAAILNTLLHMYYNTSIEDRIATERLFKSCIVPYHFDVSARVRALFTCYALVDDISIRTVQEMFKAQYTATSLVRDILHRLTDQQEEKISPQTGVQLMEKIHLLATLLPKSEKSVEHLKRFFNQAHVDRGLRNHLSRLTRSTCTCAQATVIMRELLKKMNAGHSSTTSETNLNYARSVKILLERTAPVLIDKAFGLELLTQLVVVREASSVCSNQIGSLSTTRALRLLFALAVYFKEILPVEEVLDYVITVLTDDEEPEGVGLTEHRAESDPMSADVDPRASVQELALNILCCLFGSPSISVTQSSKDPPNEPELQPAYRDQRQKCSSSLTLQLTERIVELLPLLQTFCTSGLTGKYPPVVSDSAAETTAVKRPNRGRLPAQPGPSSRGLSPTTTTPLTTTVESQESIGRAGAAWSSERRRAKLAVRLLLCLRSATSLPSPRSKRSQKKAATATVPLPVSTVDLDEEPPTAAGANQEVVSPDGGLKEDQDDQEEEECNTEFLATVGVKVQRTLDAIVETCLAREPESPDYVTRLTSLSRIGLQLPGVYNDQIKTYITKCLVPQVLGGDQQQEQPQPSSTGDSRRATAESAKGRLMTLAQWQPDGAVCRSTRAKMAAIKVMVNWLRGLKNEVKPVAQAVIRLLHRVIVNDGDLTRQGKMCPGDMSRMRLVAATAWLKLAHSQAYVEDIEVGWYQSMTYVVCDPCPKVRSHFIIKLNKGLYRLHLPLEYMAMFAHAADVPDPVFKQRARQLLAGNIQRRREFLNRNPAYANDAKFLFGLLPDYVLPYLIYLLAHDPEWSVVTDTAQLNRIKNALWFVMEPILARGHSFSFLRKIIERVKHVRDALAPDDTVANTKLYTTCDIALGLLLTRCPSLTIKEYPVDIKLPKALFAPAPSDFSNPDFVQLLQRPDTTTNIDAGASDKSAGAKEKALLQFTPVKHGRALKDGLIPPQLLKMKTKPPAAADGDRPKKKPAETRTSDNEDVDDVVVTAEQPTPRRKAVRKQTKMPVKTRKRSSPSQMAGSSRRKVTGRPKRCMTAVTKSQPPRTNSETSPPETPSPKKRTQIVMRTPEIESDCNNSPIKHRKVQNQNRKSAAEKRQQFNPPLSPSPKRRKSRDSSSEQTTNSRQNKVTNGNLRQTTLNRIVENGVAKRVADVGNKRPPTANVRVAKKVETKKASGSIKSKRINQKSKPSPLRCMTRGASTSRSSVVSPRTPSARSASKSSTPSSGRRPSRLSAVTANLKLNLSQNSSTETPTPPALKRTVPAALRKRK